MQRRKGENGAIEKKIEETKMSGITQKGIKIYTQKKKTRVKKKMKLCGAVILML